jgi:hypothetical protein
MKFPSVYTVLLCFLIASVSASAGTLKATVKNAKGEPVIDTVISLVPLDTAVLPPEPPRGEITQRDQEFTTYVTVVQAGTTVAFPNRDSVQHHVYSLSKAKKFELPLYNPGQTESFMFDVSGTITLGCNIHDWMVAYLYVVPTPYFAKTDETGTVTIKAPAGRYRLEIMQPRLAKNVSEEIVLGESDTSTRDFSLTLKPDRRIRRGLDAKSGGYR